jgi:uncharacterized protein DUF3562
MDNSAERSKHATLRQNFFRERAKVHPSAAWQRKRSVARKDFQIFSRGSQISTEAVENFWITHAWHRAYAADHCVSIGLLVRWSIRALCVRWAALKKKSRCVRRFFAMATPTRAFANSKNHQTSKEAIAKETHTSIDEVDKIYEQELRVLASDAKITQYLGVLTTRRVRAKLRKHWQLSGLPLPHCCLSSSRTSAPHRSGRAPAERP